MRLELECDDCGYVISRSGTERADWHALWAAAQQSGWGGTAAYSGRHSCPDCVSVLQSAA